MDALECHHQPWLNAIDDAYDVFADYRCPRALEASPAEDSNAMLADLTSALLRLLPSDRLANYAGSALCTVGYDFDYKHFLPRILELMIDDVDARAFDPNLTANTLIYTDFARWPKPELNVVCTVFDKALQVACYLDPAEKSLSLHIVGNVKINNNIKYIIDFISNSALSANFARHIVELVSKIVESLDKRGWPFQELPQADWTALHTWATSEQTAQRLMEGVDLVDEGDVWELEAALMALGRA